MEEQNSLNEERFKELDRHHRRGKIMGGLLIVGIGSLFLARELGAEMPAWLFSWKTLLIGLGIVSAIKHKFRQAGWLIMIAIGTAFLLPDIYPDLVIRPILWPSLLILVGLIIVFKPRRKYSDHYRRHWGKWHAHNRYYRHRMAADYCNPTGEVNKEDYIECTSIMAGIKKNVFSKTFKGGEVTNVFGGAEINLMQADFEGKINLEITQVFGATKLLVPANWEIRSAEMVTVFGSLEDKRPLQPNTGETPSKILIITGTTVFGGIDIKSY